MEAQVKREYFNYMKKDYMAGQKKNKWLLSSSVYIEEDAIIPSVYLSHKHRQLGLAALNINSNSYKLLFITNSYKLVL